MNYIKESDNSYGLGYLAGMIKEDFETIGLFSIYFDTLRFYYNQKLIELQSLEDDRFNWAKSLSFIQ